MSDSEDAATDSGEEVTPDDIADTQDQIDQNEADNNQTVDDNEAELDDQVADNTAALQNMSDGTPEQDAIVDEAVD